MKPHLTEKTYLLATAINPVYTFLVRSTDTITSVREHITNVYGKHVTDVRFVTIAKKAVKRRGITGSTTKRKKAIVILKKGESIAAFDVPSTDKKE